MYMVLKFLRKSSMQSNRSFKSNTDKLIVNTIQRSKPNINFINQTLIHISYIHQRQA
ncbi:hypothetical protein MtrunA17_Chr5g0398031 [Medicago truncatula]|uniref:Uncharacterized protein n=1 Tax=Medicago truncatula TaxID=3880 RepID=A0A396HJZ1_MEDTR|nr:hypothetical protein MtrunA17_Chr5g0398031 [Medicago truncatula]